MSEPPESLDISDLKETFLECPVCVEDYDQKDKRPRLLHPCLHAFCIHECLHKLLLKEDNGQITCPLCRNIQKITGNVQSLPMDPVRYKLVDYVQLKKRKHVVCTECGKHNAMSRCQECQSYLCKDCDYIHRNHRMTRDHAITSLEDVLKEPIRNLSPGHCCPKHPKHHLEFYCTTDEELCCVSCTVLDHKGHDLVGLDKAASERKKEVETFLKDVLEKANDMREAKQKLLKQEKKFQDTKTKSMVDIDSMFNAMKKTLSERKRALIASLDDKAKQLMSAVQKSSAALDQTLAVIESTETYYTEAKGKADVVELLKLYPVIRRSLEGVEGPQRLTGMDGAVAAMKFLKKGRTEAKLVIKKVGDFDNDAAVAEQVQDRGVFDADKTEVERCNICLEDIKDEKVLRCGHRFCKRCIEESFLYKPVCPTCGAIYGTVTGTMPPGTMTVTASCWSAPSGCSGGSYNITYDINGGIQKKEHPNPGERFVGAKWTACLPKTQEGEKVLRLLQVAFARRLTFTVGRSTTTGVENKVIWNDIHHKTSLEQGHPCGYPDPGYLNRVTEQLAAKGVTQADIVWSIPVTETVYATY